MRGYINAMLVKHTLYKIYLECFSFLAGNIGFKNTTQENQSLFFCTVKEKKTSVGLGSNFCQTDHSIAKLSLIKIKILNAFTKIEKK